MDSQAHIRRIAGRQDGVVTRGQALAAGVPGYEVGTLCLTGRWVELADRVYLIEPAAAVPRRARIRAAVLAQGPGAVAVLETAAELHGMAGLPAGRVISVAVPERRFRAASPHPRASPDALPAARRLSGPEVRLLRGRFAPHEIHPVAGIPASSPQRTATDLLLRLPRYPAVAMLDAALHRGQLTAEALPAIAVALRNRPGAAAARRHLAEADGRAHSPLETRVRLRCADGGVPPDELQHVVRDDDGHILAVADLAWLRAAVLAEADGAGPHGTPRAVYDDRRRQNTLANAGWRILRFTWADTLRPDYILAAVRAALSCPVPLAAGAGR